MTEDAVTQLFGEELCNLASDNRLRELPRLSDHNATTVTVRGRPCLLLCSNNYLGIANHPSIREAAAAAVLEYGCSASASRLVSGNLDLYRALESAIAVFMSKEDALVFSSGYAANMGIIQSVAQDNDVILSDELNHASIVDGCRLSRAHKLIFRHNDVGDLEHKLSGCRGYRTRLIVVEGVYSLDGDCAPLAEIAELARQYECMLMVDEAHAVGVLGETGRGASQLHGVSDYVDIIVGTMGKAFGSYGAFVACSAQLKQYLVNKARSMIYTTALPPAVLAASLPAIDIVQSEPWRRRDTLEKADYMRSGLLELGFDLGAGTKHIIPVILGETEQTMRLSVLLLEQGVFVQPIRPPSVLQGKSRLRVTVNAKHTYEQLDTALVTFRKARDRIRAPSRVTGGA